MPNEKLRGLVTSGVIAAAYAALSLALAPITFGTVQFRAAEALTLLPVLYPQAVAGVTLGCVITNLVGAATGANFLGLYDVLFGSAATLAAALLTMRLGGHRIKGFPLLSSLPPVLINAIVIGGEWCWAINGGFAALPFLVYSLQIGLGQLIPCCVIGVVLVRMLEKRGIGPQ